MNATMRAMDAGSGYVRVNGEKIRELRAERLMSMRELSAASGVALYTILKAEKGQNVRGLHPATVRKLARALFVPPQALIASEEDEA